MKALEKIDAKNAIIGVLAVIFMFIGLDQDLIKTHDNIVVILLWFTILLGLSKTIVQMLTGDDAPIMMRYSMAGMVIASTKEFYISMLAHDAIWMCIYGAAAVFFMGMRWWSFKITENGR